jgi:hypothetical protein
MLDFLQKKAAKKCENLQFSIKKYYFDMYDLEQKHSARDTIPLKQFAYFPTLIGQGKIKLFCVDPL